MRSPVSWSILGLVIERPSYGYELVQRFERSFSDLLNLSSASQIYTALDSLRVRGLIEELPAEQGDDAVVRQPRPHYRATPQGVEAYQRWLVSEVHDERRRSELFARQLAALEPKAALEVLERYEQICLQHACRTPTTDAPAASSSLVEEEERLATAARLAWIEYARHEFQALARARRHQR